MSLRTTILAAGCAAAAAGIAAQTELVSPRALTNSYGGIDNAIPWGPYVPAGNTLGEVLVQQIDDQLAAAPRLLRSMAFRHQYFRAHVAKTFRVTIRLGAAATPAGGIRATFASNWQTGTAPTTVLGGTLSFPAVGALPRPPADFDAPLPFAAPHAHPGGPLLWEALVHSTTPVLPTQYYERGPGSVHTAGILGSGCPVRGRTAALAATGFCTRSAIHDELLQGPAAAPVLLLMGTAADHFAGVPLPLDLGAFGAPGCFLHVAPLTALPTATSASGAASSAVGYLPSPAGCGRRLRTQWLVVEGSRLSSSNGLDHSTPYDGGCGRPWPQARVWAHGFGAAPPAAGTVSDNGLVTRWSF